MKSLTPTEINTELAHIRQSLLTTSADSKDYQKLATTYNQLTDLLRQRQLPTTRQHSPIIREYKFSFPLQLVNTLLVDRKASDPSEQMSRSARMFQTLHQHCLDLVDLSGISNNRAYMHYENGGQLVVMSYYFRN